MLGTALRKPAILPLFNIYTIAGLLGLAYLGLTIYLKLLWGEGESGVQFLYILMLAQAVPVVIAFSRRHFTYLAFIMIFHFFQLSLPKWFLFQENSNLLEQFPMLVSANKEQIFCTILIQLVYYASRVFLFGAVAEKERFQLLTLTRAQVVLLSGYVILVPIFLDKLPTWFLSVHFLLLSADVVLLFTANSPGNNFIITITKAAAIVGAFNYFLNTGMMTLMGALVSLAALISCLKKRFLVVGFIAVGVIGMSAIQTVKGAYRLVIYEKDANYTTPERVAILWELLSLKYIHDEETDVDEDEDGIKDDIGTNLISGFMRAGDDSMERVLEATPSKIPYWGGETYRSIPFMFIPRMLWPDKPSRHFWNKYGREYGVLAPNDFRTSVGVSYLSEAYMNFGYSGMYLVAILVGLLFALVERSSFFILNGYFYFPYMVLLTPLLNPASDLGSMLNSLWVIYVVFLVGRPLLMSMARRDEYS